MAVVEAGIAPGAALARRDRLVAAVTAKFPIGSVCRGESFHALIETLAGELPKEIPTETLQDSVRHLAGAVLDEDTVRATCWRLAGNADNLRRRFAVPPWSRQSFLESVPVQVVQLTRAASPTGKPGYQAALRVMAGTSCPLVLLQFWSGAFCAYLARAVFGYAKWPPKPGTGVHANIYSHATELVTLRCRVIIDPKLCRNGQPGFQKIEAAFSDWNHEQMKRRLREAAGFTCPIGRSQNLPCFTCTKGWVSCRAACHKFDYELRDCPKCGRPQVAFDPWIGGAVCLACAEQAALARA